MLRCITENGETLISSNCEEESARKLSRQKALFCPNCQVNVIFKKGKTVRPHFAHSNSDCVGSFHEPETTEHLRGKELLHSWLVQKFPNADIQYEVYIQQTQQIADILVRHTEGPIQGVEWAFEFQHSPLSSVDWAARHQLYKAAGIQDFWILDKATFLKYSKARGIQNARRRNDLETVMYTETGFCYFLDLDKAELTIDFEFYTSLEKVEVGGRKFTREYTYHRPTNHSYPLNGVEIQFITRFKHAFLVLPKLLEKMKFRASRVLHELEREAQLKKQRELTKRAKEKHLFISGIYGEDNKEIIWDFMKKNRAELTDGIMSMEDSQFAQKYGTSIELLLSNMKEYERIQSRRDLVARVLTQLYSRSDMFNMQFEIDQNGRKLEQYLTDKSQDKLKLVEYVYNTHYEVFNALLSCRPQFVDKRLGEIDVRLRPYAKRDEPRTVEDYAAEYHRYETEQEVDNIVAQIKAKIIDYNPFDDFE